MIAVNQIDSGVSIVCHLDFWWPQKATERRVGEISGRRQLEGLAKSWSRSGWELINIYHIIRTACGRIGHQVHVSLPARGFTRKTVTNGFQGPLRGF